MSHDTPGASEQAAPEYRRFLTDDKSEWIDLKDMPAPISGKRYKQLRVGTALFEQDAAWMFQWAADSLRGMHVRGDGGAFIDNVPAAADFDAIPVTALRQIFQHLGVALFTAPLPTG